MIHLNPLSHIKRLAALVVLMIIACLIAIAPAQAQKIIAVDIPAGKLSQALRVVSKQTNVTIIGKSSGLSAIHTPAVRGQMTTAQALRRLLYDTGYQARRVNDRTFRLERRATMSENSAGSSPARTLSQPILKPLSPPTTIVVKATKLDYTVRDYPGAALSVPLGDISAGEAAGGLESMLAKLPVTSGTAFGSGQNKIFVRGIADSSFNGPTQSTIGLYLGEQRLTYSASNPDLRLYDMERFELLEGPQGTLYGAGAIGGVIRMTPTVPNVDEASATIWASAVATQGGAPGYDLAAMTNIPITEKQALRGVIYHGLSGGYIDDSQRGLRNINRGEVSGGRLALRSLLSDDWTLDLSGFGQKTEARDGQYIDARLPGLTQSNATGQPFSADIWGLNATVKGMIGAVDLVSSTGYVSHDLNTRYDTSAPAPGSPRQAYDETRDINLFNHETRLSYQSADALSWLVGASALRHQDDYRQLITNTNGDAPPPLATIIYTTSEYALFGEARYAYDDTISVTVGGRLLYTQGKAERTFGTTNSVVPQTDAVRFLPVAALSWSISDDVTGYLRYQEGYRTGGITVERAMNGDPRIARFDPDKVNAFEVGLKGRSHGDAPTIFSLAASYMKWRDVQADLIDNIGFTITRNIGDADIFGLALQSDTSLTPNFNLLSGFFLNQSRVQRSTPRSPAFSTKLPNIAPYSARLSLRYRWDLGETSELIASGSLAYTGESVLDINAMEQVRQGNFASADMALTWQKPSWEIGLEATNITNTRGNRFSFGNPFQIRQENQQVPLRPFNLRLSAKLRL